MPLQRRSKCVKFYFCLVGPTRGQWSPENRGFLSTPETLAHPIDGTDRVSHTTRDRELVSVLYFNFKDYCQGFLKIIISRIFFLISGVTSGVKLFQRQLNVIYFQG